MQIDIIVPVYDAAGLLRRCLATLDRHTDPARARVLVIDDASPDPAIAPLLAEWAACSPLRPRLLANAHNLGFVGSVNRGFAETTGDALLLNADTEVTPGWLERMTAALAADPRIATATPFSNNAEICSWPEFCHAAPVPGDAARIARACVLAGPPEYPELPTAVGFCMLIRRAALAALGDFDQATFGRGYGEENDFCLRAAAHGWRNVLVDDCYVVHAGGGSFAALGLKPGGENLARLLVRYPRYNAQVAAFIAADPLAPRRARIARCHRELAASPP
ncbi:MAG: glycosyltransferase [Xanthomonadales bacterium]|nr:hypothetical protein [Xanthomonadales bacterium]MCC6594553.1 glycosyltransferase [Xanthomonadales bacterium]MCE7931853.1 glycosyltransferase [Xanthomonadales bacterium PRO6]